MSTYHPYLKNFVRKKLLLHVSTQVSHFQEKIFSYNIEATEYKNTIRLIEKIFDIVRIKTRN
jgi:hypothetical protein